MQETKTKQHDDKLTYNHLSINGKGKLHQRGFKTYPGHMNQMISYVLLIIALSSLIPALSGTYSVAKTYILLNVAMYSCVIAIMLESKANEHKGYNIIILMSVINFIVVILAIYKVF